MCGVIGIIGSEAASHEAYRSLVSLQHRGQDAAGILSYDEIEQRYHLKKNMGLVGQVFVASDLEDLQGNMALGHTRYSTIGSSKVEDLQPLLLTHPFGIGMVHNGNLVNSHELSQHLRKDLRRSLITDNDLEIIQNLFANALLELSPKNETKVSAEIIFQAVEQVLNKAKGGYSVITSLAGLGMLAFRDPNGIRPLMMGEKQLENGKKAYAFSSESHVFAFSGYSFVRNLKPGEAIYIDSKGEIFCKEILNHGARHCMFEWVYFASAEAEIEQQSVYGARLNLGAQLANEVKNKISNGEISPDIVAPVPDTSRTSAISLAEGLNLPYREVLIKNRYVHRSFILNKPEERKIAVGLKLSPVESEIKGKNILLVDDSIVRGTTSKKLTELLRKAGAKEIYFASTCPPLKHPCFYGIDFPNETELIANNKTETQVADIIGAEKVIYLSMKGLEGALKAEGLCTACLNNDYPVKVDLDSYYANRKQNERYVRLKQEKV